MCPTDQHRVSGCKFCIHEVTCLYGVATEEIYFPRRLAHCSNKDDITTTIHQINLAMLLHFYDISHIHGDFLFPASPIVPTPDITLFDHNFTRIIADDHDQVSQLTTHCWSYKTRQAFVSLFGGSHFRQWVKRFSWNSTLTMIRISAYNALLKL